MNKVFLILSIGTMLAVASCTKEKAVTATETNTEGKAVRKIAQYTDCPPNAQGHGGFVPNHAPPSPGEVLDYWSDAYHNHGRWDCDNPTGACCRDGATQISISVAHDLWEVVLNQGDVSGHFSKYTNNYIKGGLESDIVKLLITGEAKIAILGVDEKDNNIFYCEVVAPDYKLDVGFPITVTDK